MKFSERIGITPVKVELEKNGISVPLRNRLWNVILQMLERMGNYSSDDRMSAKATFFHDLWMNFMKRPLDELPIHPYGSIDETHEKTVFRSWFFKAVWYEIFDLLEYVSKDQKWIREICNELLREEKSAYRFADYIIIEIDSEEEVKELQDVLENASPYHTVRAHLQKAVAHYGDRKDPDYVNSIKESILAVESMAQIITVASNGTLGQLLKRLDEKQPIPQALKKAFSSLYGFSSEEGGIRHAMKPNGTPIGMDEARFMLVACSAFVNYLISKHAK